MSRSKMFAFNSLSAAIYQIIIMIVGFITPKVMLDVYGSELNGLITSISQFINYFSLVEAGLSGAAIYALYKPLANKNWDDISGIVVATKHFYNVSGIIFSTLVVSLSICYPFFVNTDKLDLLSISFLVLVLGGTGALDFFSMGKYRALLTADQKLYVISWSSAISLIINTVIIVILSYLRVNIVIVRLAALSSIVLRSIMLSVYVKRNYKINYNIAPCNSALDKRWDALYLQILGSIQTGAPVILATIFTSLKEISVFSIYMMVIGGITGVLSIFTTGLSSSFGDVIARDEKEVLQKSFQEFETLLYMIITFIFGMTFITIVQFVHVYTKNITDANYINELLAFLITLNALLYNLKTPQGMLIISAGHYRETRLQTTIQGLIMVIGGIILAYGWGLYGIMIASILSNIYRDIDLLLYVPNKITGLPIKTTLKKWCMIAIELCFIMMISKVIHFSITNIVDWIVMAVCYSIISGVIIFLISFIFDRDQIKSLFNRLKILIGR